MHILGLNSDIEELIKETQVDLTDSLERQLIELFASSAADHSVDGLDYTAAKFVLANNYLTNILHMTSPDGLAKTHQDNPDLTEAEIRDQFELLSTATMMLFETCFERAFDKLLLSDQIKRGESDA
jgi:hypothetical protein